MEDRSSPVLAAPVCAKLIGLRGVEPTVTNLKNGTFPIVYDVSFVTKDAPNPQSSGSASLRRRLMENR